MKSVSNYANNTTPKISQFDVEKRGEVPDPNTNNINRNTILIAIIQNPGIRYRELLRLTDLSNGVLAFVTVKDTGPGIDPEMLSRLFSKFATKSDRRAGLGLFICKNIIEAHGGRIWAENNSDGKGAKFSFSLAIKN